MWRVYGKLLFACAMSPCFLAWMEFVPVVEFWWQYWHWFRGYCSVPWSVDTRSSSGRRAPWQWKTPPGLPDARRQNTSCDLGGYFLKWLFWKCDMETDERMSAFFKVKKVPLRQSKICFFCGSFYSLKWHWKKTILTQWCLWLEVCKIFQSLKG